MTTAISDPVRVHAQAVQIARHLRASINKPRKDPVMCKVAIAMDDAIRFIDIAWTEIETLSEEELTTIICASMRTPVSGDISEN